MKKTIVILLLFAFTLSSTELHQLLKVPQLVTHFIQHQRLDGQISFIDFLIMHYQDIEKETDDHQHHNLPFKSQCTAINHTIIAEVHNFDQEPCLTHFYFKKATTIYQEVFYTSMLTESIWQPPKCA